MVAGNKVAEAFSELCFDDAERRGVGLSRLAEAMISAIERLSKTERYQNSLKEELRALVEVEATDLLPAFQGGLCWARSSRRGQCFYSGSC